VQITQQMRRKGDPGCHRWRSALACLPGASDRHSFTEDRSVPCADEIPRITANHV